MTFTKEPYAYFQPGEIFYFISHESDKPINRTTGVSKPDGPVNVESSSAADEEPIFNPETSGLEGDESNNTKHDDDDEKDHDDDDALSYDQKIDRLIDWSNKVVKNIQKEFQLENQIEISRDKKREIHFPGTLHEEPAKHTIMEFNEGSETKPKIPKSVPHGAFSLIPPRLLISADDEIGKNRNFKKTRIDMFNAPSWQNWWLGSTITEMMMANLHKSGNYPSRHIAQLVVKSML